MNSKITYRQQYTRCGKQRCRKCREGAGHGPYWYAYWSEKGRTVSKYIGSRLPEHIEAARQSSEEIEKEHTLTVAKVDPNSSSPLLRVYLLGQFRIERYIEGEWKAVDNRTWHRRRARALLGCLLSISGRRLGREQIMELLWPDLDIDVAANRLNGAVHELRQILEPDIARPAYSRLLRLEREVLELADSSFIWVDAEEFEHLLKEAHACTDPKQVESLLEAAASLYHGSYLLEELYSEWATPRRDALHRAWVGLLLDLADMRAEQGAYVSAIEILDRLRIADPTNETALQRLMILLTHLDRRGEALQVYRQYASTLKRDYEGEPLPETRELYESLRQGQIPTMYTVKKSTGQLAQLAETPSEKESSQPEPASATATQPSSLQEVSFARPALQLGRHNQSPLVGRERELQTMQNIMLSVEGLRTARFPSSGDPAHHALQPPSPATTARLLHFLLLKGESGIGKTRLAEELSLEAYTRGWAVAWSRSYEQEGTIPYHLWTELLRTLFQGTSTFENLLHIVAPSGETNVPLVSPLKLERLSTLLPELVAHAAHTSSGRATPPVPHEQERLHLWEGTLGLLSALSKLHPLLLVLDDLHWADDSSIELLTYLTHHIQDQRILILGTCRDGELSQQHKLHTLIADLRREQAITALSIHPLTNSQIGSLLSHLPQDVVQSIQEQAAGNPFFAEELARYIRATYHEHEPTDEKEARLLSSVKELSQHTQREPTRPHRSLPEAIEAVLERRLSRLSGGCQVLLSKAAVLGGSFELSQLLPLAGDQSEDTVVDLLEEALRAGLLTEEGTGAHIIYHFWHPLIIKHLYEHISAARRAQLHRRVAEAIKAANPTAPEKVAAAIVYHLSRGGGDSAQISHYAELAGNQAYTMGAYTEAQQYYLQAIQAVAGDELRTHEEAAMYSQILSITPHLLSRIARANPLRICRILERIAECSVIQGTFEDAQHLYTCALDLRTSKDFQQQTGIHDDEHKLRQEAQLQGLIWRELGNTWRLTGDYARAYECYGHGKEVMYRVGVTSGPAWAGLQLQYGEMYRLEGNYQEARSCIQEALAMLECFVPSAATSSLEATANRARLEALLPDNEASLSPRELQTRTERALLGDPLEIGYAHERLGIIAASLSQLNEALTHMRTALTFYEKSELVSEMARVCSNLGGIYLLKGELDLARRYTHRSLELAERCGDIPNMAFVMLNLGDLEHRSGNLLESEEWFKRSLAIAERINDRERMSWCHVDLAAVQQNLGKLNEAATNIRQAISIGREIKSTRCIRYALLGLGDLRLTGAIITCQFHSGEHQNQQGEHITPPCQRLLHRAQATLQRAISLDGLERESIIEGRHLLATAYFLLGDLEDAQQLALQVLKDLEEYEAIRTVGRTYRLLGRILAAQKHFDEAIEYYKKALQIFLERGLRLDYARALHGYGVTLIFQGQSVPTVAGNQSTPSTQYRAGLDSLHEAHAIFSICRASIDVTWVEHVLSQYESHFVVQR
ncbi:MAG TPA: DUF6788 family protein [Ktedonosporobacter sp.]|jgi:predicted ATPase/DNA-binding SARP family transcriptional activator|nr:DUF6788 family protein [Ktedonosporobacter sp.]